jgi:hypothetical protein
MILSDTLQAAINNAENKQKFVSNVGEDFANKQQDSDLPYTAWEYHCAFDSVANKENWKLPLCAIIDTKDRQIIGRSILNATATPANFDSVDDGILEVSSEGYYVGTGEA